MSDNGKPGKVYVGGIGGDVTRDELDREYSKFGRIKEVWVAKNPPGFAFVEFMDERDAEEAIRETDGKKVCGYRANVQASHGKQSKRKRDAEEVRCHKCSRWGHSGSVCTRYPGDSRRSRSPARGGRRSRSPYGRRSPPRRGGSPPPRRRSPPRRSPPRRSAQSPGRYSPTRSPREYRRRTRSPRPSRSPRYRRRSRSPLPARSRSPLPARSRSPADRSPSPAARRPHRRSRTSRSPRRSPSPVKKRESSPVSPARDAFSPQSVENVSHSPTPQRSDSERSASAERGF